MALAGSIVTGDPWLTRSLNTDPNRRNTSKLYLRITNIKPGNLPNPIIASPPSSTRTHIFRKMETTFPKTKTQNLGQIWFSGDYGWIADSTTRLCKTGFCLKRWLQMQRLPVSDFNNTCCTVFAFTSNTPDHVSGLPKHWNPPLPAPRMGASFIELTLPGGTFAWLGYQPLEFPDLWLYDTHILERWSPLS